MVDRGQIERGVRGSLSVVARRRLAPPIRFLLLTPGRSGSTLLMSLLASTPWVRSEAEVLRTATGGDPARRLARRAARGALGNVRAWGTSVHPEHLLPLLAGDPVAWVGGLHDDGWELLTLLRRNPLEHVLSAAIAWERGEWHFVDGAVPTTDPIRLDPVAVLREAALVERSAREVQTMVADRSHLALVYEDDLRDAERQQATVDRVLEFLRLPSAEVSTPFARRSVGLLEQIANADEVLGALRATRFEPFVDELT